MQTPLPVDQPSEDEELYGLPPDPDIDPPDGAEAWLAGLPTPLLEDQLQDGRSSLARLRVIAAGFLPRDRTGSATGTGAGFGPGEVLDTMDAGPVLAGLAADAWTGGLSQLADDELVGVLTAWRRVASWATAGELAAVAELTGRRRQQASDGASPDLVRFLPDELATALTLTLRSANRLLDVATGLAGSVNLTMPLASWLGAAQAPGEVAGFGPVDAGTCRTLGAALAARPGGRWCLTLTDAAGRAVGHGCARRAPAGSGWALHIKITDLATPACQHRTHPDTRQPPDRYRPSRRLRHLIEVRHRTCSFRGCRRAAPRCDVDHTIPHHLGGVTCRCNLAPLCRRHHQAKQAQGWCLDQPEPGILVWTLPHGRRYRVEPDPYPAG